MRAQPATGPGELPWPSHAWLAGVRAQLVPYVVAAREALLARSTPPDRSPPPPQAGERWSQPLTRATNPRIPLHRVFAKQQLDMMIAEAWMNGMPPAALAEVTKLSIATGGGRCTRPAAGAGTRYYSPPGLSSPRPSARPPPLSHQHTSTPADQQTSTPTRPAPPQVCRAR
jgi:hypothetical protein